MAVLRDKRAIPKEVSDAARDAGFSKPDLYSGRVEVKRGKVSGRYRKVSGGQRSKLVSRGVNGKRGSRGAAKRRAVARTRPRV
jgi:hypothetical protein